MTPHDHRQFVPGCYRCGLSRDEERAQRSQLADEVARAFHETYERLAPEFGYVTRDASAVPWTDVPDVNKKLMVAVAYDLLSRDVIG
jgi:hypothetical protein